MGCVIFWSICVVAALNVLFRASRKAVTAEIRTDARRVIEFVLSPVLRHLRESARER